MVYYERPENTLNTIGPLAREQAIKLVESFSAADIACFMELGHENSGAIVIPMPPASEYRLTMERTARALIQAALKRAGGNQHVAAAALGLPISTFTSLLRRLKRPTPQVAVAAAAAR